MNLEKISDLLLVIENYKGISEHNALSTKEEFLNLLSKKGFGDFVADAEFLLDNERSCFEWKSLGFAGGLLEFRRCRDENDLCAFLDGKHNDSIEKMENRGLHTFGAFNSFKYDIPVSSISPASISLLSTLQHKNPSIKERCQALFSEKSSLDDIIKNCVQNQGQNTHRSDMHLRRLPEL